MTPSKQQLYIVILVLAVIAFPSAFAYIAKAVADTVITIVTVAVVVPLVCYLLYSIGLLTEDGRLVSN